MKHVARLVVGLAALVFAEAPVHASDCGIDRVERTRTGVKVYFSKPTSVTVARPEKPPLNVMVDASSTREMDSAGAGPVAAVSGVLGDRIYLTWSTHSGCNMVVATRGDDIGVYETLGASAPGLVPFVKSNFTAAK
jgi:hypothetical protein